MGSEMCIRDSSQYGPMNPGLQLHTNVLYLFCGKQVPPFWHGEGEATHGFYNKTRLLLIVSHLVSFSFNRVHLVKGNSWA